MVGAIEHIRDRLLGTDPARIEDAWQTAYRLGFYRGGSGAHVGHVRRRPGVVDIKGRRLDVPVWELLGGQVRKRIDVYAWIGGDRPADVAAAAAERKEQGFRAVKMNGTGDLGWLDSPSALGDAVERLRLVRDVGLDVGVDFHGRVHKPMARQLIRALEPLRRRARSRRCRRTSSATRTRTLACSRRPRRIGAPAASASVPSPAS